MRLIDADALAERVKKNKVFTNEYTQKSFEVMVLELIDKQDTVEPKQGEWIRIDKWVDKMYVGGFIHKDCPMIKTSDDCFYAPWRYNFCPNCGARMKGGDEE